VAKVIAATPPVGSGTVVGAPEVAGDVDVIEPEWVDKAEKVVEEHAKATRTVRKRPSRICSGIICKSATGFRWLIRTR
jgi:hypothetical protein